MSLPSPWLIALGMVIAVSSRSEAQGIAGSFEQLQLLVRTGDTITVRETSGTETTGKIGSLSASSLELLAGGSRREFRESDVSTILQQRSDPLRNGAIWGLVGGLAFSGAFVLIYCTEGDCYAPGMAIGVAVYAAAGTGIGVGVDALITRRQLIFERRGRAVTFGVAPLMTDRRRGASVGIAF